VAQAVVLVVREPASVGLHHGGDRWAGRRDRARGECFAAARSGSSGILMPASRRRGTLVHPRRVRATSFGRRVRPPPDALV